jgi:diacylglycerol kinase family enzyme
MLDQDLKRRIGKVAYAGPLLRALIRPIDRLHVTVDSRSHTASWAVVANAMHYGGGFAMAPRTHIFERGLEAILFKVRNPVVLLGQLMKLAAGQLEPHATDGGKVEMLRCSRVTVEAQERVPTQIDGDVLGTTPLEVDAGTSELHLIVPTAGKPARQSVRSGQLDEKVVISEASLRRSRPESSGGSADTPLNRDRANASARSSP